MCPGARGPGPAERLRSTQESVCDRGRDGGGWREARERWSWKERLRRTGEELRGDPTHWEERLGQPAEVLEGRPLPASPQAHGEDLQRPGAHLQVAAGQHEAKCCLNIFEEQLKQSCP